ncbi:hypothetical protein KIW84_072395, partial [Lathyrus oleraceus]
EKERENVIGKYQRFLQAKKKPHHRHSQHQKISYPRRHFQFQSRPTTSPHIPQRQTRSPSESESVLRQFDMNTVYGPCIGMTRLARWERAVNLGLNPPQEIERLLKSGKVQQESLWDSRI